MNSSTNMRREGFLKILKSLFFFAGRGVDTPEVCRSSGAGIEPEPQQSIQAAAVTKPDP